MASLRQVHLKIQELGKNGKDIPIEDVLQAFKTSPDIIKNLEYLVHLGLIEVDHAYRGTIRLTMHGKHTNIP